MIDGKTEREEGKRAKRERWEESERSLVERGRVIQTEVESYREPDGVSERDKAGIDC